MCRQFIVKGRVQGVFFRVSTRDVAASLKLTGHSINLHDGSVDVRACGDTDAVNQLAEWLHQGPRGASVTAVEEHDTACTSPDRFIVG